MIHLRPCLWLRTTVVVWFVTTVLAVSTALVPGETVAPLTRFRALEGSTVRISGQATLGEWKCETSEILAVIEPGASLAALSAGINGTDSSRGPCRASALGPIARESATMPYANITIPVASLRCSKPGMRRDLLRALKHEEAPLIVFVLTAVTNVEVQGRRNGNWGSYRVTAQGDLVLAGQLRSIEVEATVVQESARHFCIEAKKDLSMSDFEIAPPTALFGAIRADDRVTITFDLKFARQIPPLPCPAPKGDDPLAGRVTVHRMR